MPGTRLRKTREQNVDYQTKIEACVSTQHEQIACLHLSLRRGTNIRMSPDLQQTFARSQSMLPDTAGESNFAGSLRLRSRYGRMWMWFQIYGKTYGWLTLHCSFHSGLPHIGLSILRTTPACLQQSACLSPTWNYPSSTGTGR